MFACMSSSWLALLTIGAVALLRSLGGMGWHVPWRYQFGFGSGSRLVALHVSALTSGLCVCFDGTLPGAPTRVRTLRVALQLLGFGCGLCLVCLRVWACFAGVFAGVLTPVATLRAALLCFDDDGGWCGCDVGGCSVDGSALYVWILLGPLLGCCLLRLSLCMAARSEWVKEILFFGIGGLLIAFAGGIGGRGIDLLGGDAYKRRAAAGVLLHLHSLCADDLVGKSSFKVGDCSLSAVSTYCRIGVCHRVALCVVCRCWIRKWYHYICYGMVFSPVGAAFVVLAL